MLNLAAMVVKNLSAFLSFKMGFAKVYNLVIKIQSLLKLRPVISQHAGQFSVNRITFVEEIRFMVFPIRKVGKEQNTFFSISWFSLELSDAVSFELKSWDVFQVGEDGA